MARISDQVKHQKLTQKDIIKIFKYINQHKNNLPPEIFDNMIHRILAELYLYYTTTQDIHTKLKIANIIDKLKARHIQEQQLKLQKEELKINITYQVVKSDAAEMDFDRLST